MPLDTSTAIEIASGLLVWDEDAKESVRDGMPQASRTLLCAWDDRWDIVNALGVGEDGNGAEYPDNAILRARNMDIVAVVGDDGNTVGPNGMYASKYARLNVEYLLPEDNVLVDGEEVGGEEIDFSAEPIVYSAREVTWKFEDGTGDLDPTWIPSRTERTVEFSKWARGFETLPLTLILSLIDKANSVTFLGADPETIVFLGGRSFRKILTTGAAKWDVSWRHIFKRSGHNKIFDPKTGTFKRIVAKNNASRSLFETGDLNALYP